MDFQGVPEVKDPDALLHEALVAARRKLREGKRRASGVRERERLTALHQHLSKTLGRIPAGFPNLDELNEFYTRLFEEMIGIDDLRKALGAVAWARGQIPKVARSARFTREMTKPEAQRVAKGTIGRVASILKQISRELALLAEARSRMRSFPALKEGYTVAIAGFPNVGKSTLLGKLTTSTPKIAAYAFTTTTLNVGYLHYRHHAIQCIDTPGTLARPERMNQVERLAALAMRYAAHVIIYVFDLTEPYPIEEQEVLLGNIEEMGKEVLCYVSKTDILDERLVDAFTKRRVCYTDVEELEREITRRFATEYLEN